jgi:hypothetical protein
MWPLGKAPRFGVVIKLLRILHYYWFIIMLLMVLGLKLWFVNLSYVRRLLFYSDGILNKLL